MKADELREMTPEELNNRIETLRREIYNLEFKSVVEQIDNNSIFRKNRREIARIRTIVKERQVKAKDKQ
ncbi:MAG: 50S ribosomal protein L29 [Planctomycetota bacterium]